MENSLTGKLKSVYCKNFVTYEECKFYPTPYLNIIIGPNGTGKSTLVAAIVLGLGGEPKLLSRSAGIDDYIKNGQTAAQIEIEIYTDMGGNKTITFGRSFDKSGQSEFKMNLKSMSKTKFLAAVAAYRIQISNLCQFLPQDRVQDFAKMNPQEILQNTIVSVCEPKFIEEYQTLRTLKTNELNKKSEMEKVHKGLQETIKRVEELSKLLQMYQVHEDLKDKVQISNAKILWLQVDEINKDKVNLAKDLRLAEVEQEKYRSLSAANECKLAEIQEESACIGNEVKTHQNATAKALARRSAVSNKIDDTHKELVKIKQNFEKAKREFVDGQKELRNETQMLEITRVDLQKAKDTIDEKRQSQEMELLDEELQRHRTQTEQLERTRYNINKQLDEECTPHIQELSSRIRRIEDIEQRKLQNLASRFPDNHKAVLWLRQNHQLFKGKVYEPMILELNIRSAENAKYFENTIALRDLLAFTCEEKSDVSLLIDELCTKMKLKINVVYSAAASECTFEAEQSIENLKKYGFTAFLIDLIDGPAPILNYLCSLYRLQSIPIGTEEVDRHTDSIPSNIRLYFGGDHRYAVTVSRYTQDTSNMQSTIKPRNLLISADQNEVHKLVAKRTEIVKKSDALKNQRTALEANLQEQNHLRHKLMEKKRAIEGMKVEYRRLVEKCKRQTEKITQIKKSAISIDQLEKKQKSDQVLQITQLLQLQQELVDVLKAFQLANSATEVAKCKLAVHQRANEAIKTQASEGIQKKLDAEKCVRLLQQMQVNAENQLKAKVLKAKELCNNCKPTDRKYIHREVYSLLPNTIDELKEGINEFRARLECMETVDPQTLQEHQDKSEQIQVLRDRAAAIQSDNNDLQQQIQDVYDNWFPQLNEVIHSLNSHFSNFMQSMGYVGEIMLARSSDFDFDSYGIQIRVQYRKNIPLQTLDRHVQSGGERAVAIAVYTLAMQHLSCVPFRCVDEINQGMDPRNEKKVFEMLVGETTQTGRPQYFFVTPKLLPNMPFNERMSVHVVFNGKMVKKNGFSFSI